MNYWRVFWCSFLHGGGYIKRDEQGQINWQCLKCGRWAQPVEIADEIAMTNKALEATKP